MQLKESGEMYLETIYVLSKKSNYIRSIDVCEEMGYSKPSVSRAVGLLKEGGYLKVGDDGSLILTDLGREIAEKTYERPIPCLGKFKITDFYKHILPTFLNAEIMCLTHSNKACLCRCHKLPIQN